MRDYGCCGGGQMVGERLRVSSEGGGGGGGGKW